MPNDVSKSPYIIDTVATPAASATVHVAYIYWLNPTTTGHTAVIQDESNRDIANFRCEAGNQSQILWVDRVVTALNVPTLTSGKLYVYLRLNN